MHSEEEESFPLRGNYSIDKSHHSPSLRPSLEAAYQFTSDEDLDEFDPLNYDEGTLRKNKVKAERKQKKAQFLEPNSESKSKKWPQSKPHKCLSPRRICCCIVLFLTIVIVLVLSAGGIWAWKNWPPTGLSPPWYPSPKGGTDEEWAESYKKAAGLVKKMTLVEKVNITTGIGWSMGLCVGNTGSVARIGFPSLCLQDGPLGIRFADNITAFPAGVTVGATWNKELMFERGRALGLEARLKGVNILLGPSVGSLGRMPAGGRNWEGFGPDPVLQGLAAAQTIKGIQEQGVMATVKHYIANEQEHFRQSWEFATPNAISSNIDDRTLHELYAWPFAESVRAGVASVMCSYNQVNNSYACGNSKLLNGILKDELGFQGFVMSDWLAQRSGVSSALAGLDMTMPGDGLRWADGQSLWGPELTKAVLNTSVPMERINDMATRVIATWFQLGQDDQDKWPLPPPEGDGGPNFSSWTNEEYGLLHPRSDDESVGIVNRFIDAQGQGSDSHGRLSRKIAAEGHVLVKNEDEILPLSRNGLNSTEKKFHVGIFGEDSRENQNGINSCDDRGCNDGTLTMGWGSGTAELPYIVSPMDALISTFNKSVVQVSRYPMNVLPEEEEGLLDDQDLCIVFINANSGEGFITVDGNRGDRQGLFPQKHGSLLVEKVAKGCGKGEGSTIVVIHAVGPVIVEEWVDLPGIKAIVLAHLPGQESGNALVDVLFGNINPSGRLPYTVAKKEDDYGPGGKVMYWPNGIVPQQNFTEGIYIDYRHFDKFEIEPRYEFGYGLSYTTFHLSSMLVQQKRMKSLLPAERPAGLEPPSYSGEVPEDPSTAIFPAGFHKLKNYIYPYLNSVDDVVVGDYPYPAGYDTPAPLSEAGGGPGGNSDLYTVHVLVSAMLTNVGSRAGQAVVQLYISYPENYVDEETGGGEGGEIDFPVKVLRNFVKVDVDGGNSRVPVEFELTRKDLSYWCARRGNWVMPTTGQFTIHLGFSSRDLRLEGYF